MNRDIPIVILNGGKSSRMGHDKSQLLIEGKTLLERSIELASALSDQVYISGKSGADNLPVLLDFANDIGPMGGIVGAMANLSKNERVTFIPVDMPFLTATTLQKLISVSASSSAVLMDMKGSPIPVAAVYTQSAGVVFRGCIQTGDFSLQKALRFIDFIPVAAHDARECMNINTPEDFRLISKL